MLWTARTSLVRPLKPRLPLADASVRACLFHLVLGGGLPSTLELPLLFLFLLTLLGEFLLPLLEPVVALWQEYSE